MTEPKKPSTWRQVWIGVVGTAATALVTLGITEWSAAASARSKLDQEVIDRLEALEADRSKWELLAEHETRLREAEIAARVHQALLNRVMPGGSPSELAAQLKALQALMAGPVKPTPGEMGPPAPVTESAPQAVQQALPLPRVDPDALRNKWQPPAKKRKK